MDALMLTLPYYLCSIAGYGTAVLSVVMANKRLHPRRILFLAAAFVLLGTMFFMLAATARTGGYLDRVKLAVAIRMLSLGGALLWLTWLWLAVRATVSVNHRSR